jgi:UDP-glucose 4-epimerase
MKILITGGAGFIGSHVVEGIIEETKIKKIIILDNLKDGSKKNLKNVLTNKKIKLIKKDINNLQSIESSFKGIDFVIHLAALSDVVPSIENPKEYLNTNIMGTVNVLEAMRKNKVKNIIYSASSSCYGNKPKVPTNESAKINPKYPYAFSKYIGEMTIKHYADVYDLNYASLRLFNVYGTRSRTNGAYGAAIGVFLKQKLSNHPYTIIGDGKQKRDFIYVTDVVKVVKILLKKKLKNVTYNIGIGNPRSVNELVKILGGKKIFIPKRPGEPFSTHADIKRVTRELDWKPKILLNEGLKKVLKEINYWKKSPLWTAKKINNATISWFKLMKD